MVEPAVAKNPLALATGPHLGQQADHDGDELIMAR